jgi:hypothetical protein
LLIIPKIPYLRNRIGTTNKIAFILYCLYLKIILNIFTK